MAAPIRKCSYRLLKVLPLSLLFIKMVASQVAIDDSGGLGRTFDGIGAISGGGATSKLLVTYPEQQRNEILDYLFTPKFGASLHILKVEIGGDAQSTEGTEASHMHNSWDENYNRGYEWWVMKEAKKRNPNIKLYALPWAFPGWLGKGSGSPYTYPNITARYVINWIQGALKYHNLTIDYVGIWNEKSYNVKYVQILRSMLDDSGFSHIKICAADGTWFITGDILKNSDFAKTVDFIGVHYPGTVSTSDALKTNKQLWSSEDYSTFNDNTGAGCWARILNQNYVNGMMTSTIAWNLVAAYYQKLPFGRTGLMTAEEPWSGHYSVNSPIWITAHTTQFTDIGWTYLKHGSGVGKLPKGGSYVSLISPNKKNFTLIIETMSHDHSECVRPLLFPYAVQAQNVTFQLKGNLANITKLYIWYSSLKYGAQENKTQLFQSAVPGKVINGKFSLFLDVDTVITVTTVATGNKGSHSSPPSSGVFPLPYSDDFNTSQLHGEASNFDQQVGAFEIQTTKGAHGQVLRQMVLNAPIHWCEFVLTKPMTVLGNFNWSDIAVEADVLVEKVNGTRGAFIAARVDRGGCISYTAKGIYFWIYPVENSYAVTNDLSSTQLLTSGVAELSVGTWYNLRLEIKMGKVSGYLNKKMLFSIKMPSWPPHGFVGLGTDNFGYASFDNFHVDKV